MKCLYKSNVELFRSMQTVDAKEQEIKKLQAELAKYLVKEQQEKEKTGLMDVKEPIDLSNAKVQSAKDDKQLAKDLLEVESVVDDGNTS